MIRAPLLVCLLATMSACAAPAPFDLDAARREIAELNSRFTQAHLAGDVALIDAMFTSDATSYPPGGAAVTGAQALHDFTAGYIAAGLTEFREESTDFYGNAEVVVDAGTYVVTYGPDKMTERGKYLNVWKRVNGTWRIQSNIWNADAPASPSAEIVAPDRS